MSQIVRQNNLFAGEDFTKIFKSFQNVDFTAYDYNTLKSALIEYVQRNYPEDFNDYIESSEYVAIIELLAYLGTSLAFRTDINTRENFLDTAQRKESIIRLARMLSYQPRRNIAGSGLFKIVGIQTTESVYDSAGRNLESTPIYWNDSNNPDSYEQFITILNAALVNTNTFGKPNKRGTIGNILSEIYTLNNLKNFNVVYQANVNVNGESIPLEIVNSDFIDNQYFLERHPDPLDGFNMIYRNDGLGLGSSNTGFFVMFKQGQLYSKDYQFNFPVKDRVELVDIDNINETDIFVQEINDLGNVLEKWTKVPSVVGNNVIFNSIELNQRKIFSVISDYNDRVKIKFADGNFGDTPTGTFRVWARASLGRNVVIRPEDVGLQIVSIPYLDSKNQNQVLTLTYRLEQTVANAAPAESDAQIKERAPQVFYSQNRMVNNEDYNVFPLTRGNEIAKLRTVNRTYAGHSRFIDINDPTGFHQSIMVFGDDGAIYKEDEPSMTEVDIPISGVVTSIITENLEDFMENLNLENFFYDTYYKKYLSLYPDSFIPTDPTLRWKTKPDNESNDTGYFVTGGAPASAGSNAQLSLASMRFIKIGSKITFFDPFNPSDEKTVTVKSVSANGVPSSLSYVTGPIKLSSEINKNWVVKQHLPPIRTDFTAAEILAIETQMNLRNSFQLGFTIDESETSAIAGKWYIMNVNNLNTSTNFSILNTMPQPADSWLITVEYLPTTLGDSVESYRYSARGTRYIFESLRDVRFYFDENNQSFDINTGLSVSDKIVLSSENKRPSLVEVWKYDVTTSSWKLEDSSVSYPHSIGIFLTDREFNLTDITVGITSGLTYAMSTTLSGVLKISGTPNASSQVTITYNEQGRMGRDLAWDIYQPVILEDGYLDSSKVEIVASDDDKDGTAEIPLIFDDFVTPTDRVFFEKYIDFDGYEYFRPCVANYYDFSGTPVANVTPGPTYQINSLNVVTGDIFKFDTIGNLNSYVASVNNLATFLSSTDQKNYVIALGGKIVFVKNTELFYQFSYTTGISQHTLSFANDTNHYVRNGRSFQLNQLQPEDNLYFKWKHFAPAENRIDPSVSNIMDMYILTNTYYRDMLIWKDEKRPLSEMPVPPTTEELRIQFSEIEQFKMLSDQIVFNPTKFKLLFGKEAEAELQATFKVVKVPNITVTDNEIKSRVVEAIDEYFDIVNFDFGEGFYYTELAAYIHTRLVNVIASVVIVPKKAESSFGDLFQIKAEPTELFMSMARVNDVEIVNNLTNVNLRTK